MTAPNSNSFTGKNVLVTGASKGLGAEIAAEFARAGANVVVNYASTCGRRLVVEDITAAGGHAISVKADIANSSEVDALLSSQKVRSARWTSWSNNAGIMRRGSLEESTPALFYKLFDVNVLGVLLSTRRFAAHATNGASIINISALSSRLAPPNQGIYSATKAAVDALTHTYANELGPRGIRVNAISPGFIVTEGTQASGLVDSEMGKARIAQTPLRRAGQPDEIASAAIFLASDSARYITGQIIEVSGGV